MDFHPLANAFPLLETDDLALLAEDIAANGLREPLVTLDGLILDGRNRYKACVAAGVAPEMQPFMGLDPVAFVISKNLHRRHLTASQKAIVAAELLPPLQVEAKKRQAAAGGAEPGPLGEAVVGKAAAHAGNLLGVSSAYVEQAKKLLVDAPDLAEQVKAGTLTLPEAKNAQAPESPPKVPAPKYQPPIPKKMLAPEPEPEPLTMADLLLAVEDIVSRDPVAYAHEVNNMTASALEDAVEMWVLWRERFREERLLITLEIASVAGEVMTAAKSLNAAVALDIVL